MTNRLELPAWVFTDKPNYPTRPGRDVIRAIKEFIAQHGTPHFWPGHSHSKPQEGARIVYLGEFDLPKSHSGKDNADRWAPCPCCHLHHPKYYKNGMIAWFPTERVIRLLGPQCFRRLNPEGHDSAVAQYRKEQRIRKDIAFLLAHLHLLHDAIRATVRAVEIGEAVDGIRTSLRTKISGALEIPNFWQHVRTGILMVSQRRQETVELDDGTKFTRDKNEIVPYGALPGHRMLEPGADELARELRNALAAFRAIEEFGGARINPSTLLDKERRQVARVFERGLKTAARAFDEIEEVRKFISPLGIGALAGWGKHPGAPANFHAALDGRTLELGRSSYEYHRTMIPENFFGVLPALPRIGEVNIDDAPDVHLDAPAPAQEDIA
jgi:hypothetical protein